MPRLRLDDLRSTRLGVAGAVYTMPSAPPPGRPLVLTPKALAPEDASRIYAGIARFGFTGLQIIPGGARMVSENNVTQLSVTGTGWEFVEDLSSSTYELATDKLGVVVSLLKDMLPNSSLLASQTVDLQAHWTNLKGQRADDYIASRFLKPEVSRLGDNMSGLEFNGGAIRLNFLRDSPVQLPPGVNLVAGSGAPKDSIDVRIEPFYQDKGELFLQVVGTFALTNEFRLATERVDLVRGVLWNSVAPFLAHEDGGDS